MTDRPDDNPEPEAQPSAAEPVAAEPVAAEPAAVEPTAVEPTAVELTAAELIAAEPASEPVDGINETPAPLPDDFSEVLVPDEPSDFIAQLDVYKGPLDLLLYLIQENEVSIENIPIALILDQYSAHIDVIQTLDINRAGDFILMATRLLEIKSKLALPVQTEDAVDLDDIEDPRDELVTQLLEYQKMKRSAHGLKLRYEEWEKRFGRDPESRPKSPDIDPSEIEIDAELYQLVRAFDKILQKTLMSLPAEIHFDGATVEDKKVVIVEALETNDRLAFVQLFTEAKDRWDVVATFLAILELARNGLLVILQSDDYREIFIEKKKVEPPEKIVSIADAPGAPEEMKQAFHDAAADETKQDEQTGETTAPVEPSEPVAPPAEPVTASRPTVADSFTDEAELLYVDDEERQMEEKMREILEHAESIQKLIQETDSGKTIPKDWNLPNVPVDDWRLDGAPVPDGLNGEDAVAVDSPTDSVDSAADADGSAADDDDAPVALRKSDFLVEQDFTAVPVNDWNETSENDETADDDNDDDEDTDDASDDNATEDDAADEDIDDKTSGSDA